LQVDLLRAVGTDLEGDEVAVFDAGFHLSELQVVGVPRYVVRLACNATARRAKLPERKPDTQGASTRIW